MPLGPNSINWPASPTAGQTYQSPDGRVWEWTGYAWDKQGPAATPGRCRQLISS